MLKNFSLVAAMFVALSACAHHEAIRVDCDGPLRPINRPVSVTKDKESSTRPTKPTVPEAPREH